MQGRGVATRALAGMINTLDISGMTLPYLKGNAA